MMLDPATVGAMQAEQHCLAGLQTKSFPVFEMEFHYFYNLGSIYFFHCFFLVQVDFFWASSLFIHCVDFNKRT